MRRLDQEHLLDRVFGHVGEAHQGGIGEFHHEQGAVFGAGLDAHMQHNFVMVGADRPGLEVHAQVHIRIAGEPRRRARILEGQILDILADNLEIGLVFAAAAAHGSRRP